MSNIYEALNRRKSAGGVESAESAESAAPAEPLSPLVPRAERDRALPNAGSVARDRELEQLRQRILVEFDPATPTAILFAGAVPGEGASTLALLLARELAAWEQRPVLLIDADLGGFPRSLTGALGDGDDTGPGFSDVLADRAPLADGIRATEQSNLHFLPRGSAGLATTELMAPERLQRFVREAKRHYAFLVFDGSPLVLAAETARLAAAVDGAIIVVRAQRTRREVVQKATRLLQQARARSLGVVLNERRYPIPGFIYRRL